MESQKKRTYSSFLQRFGWIGPETTSAPPYARCIVGGRPAITPIYGEVGWELGDSGMSVKCSTYLLYMLTEILKKLVVFDKGFSPVDVISPCNYNQAPRYFIDGVIYIQYLTIILETLGSQNALGLEAAYCGGIR